MRTNADTLKIEAREHSRVSWFCGCGCTADSMCHMCAQWPWELVAMRECEQEDAERGQHPCGGGQMNPIHWANKAMVEEAES